MISNSDTTRRLLAITAAAGLTAMSSIACSGSPLAAAPFAPSAVPAMTLSAESGDASDTWGALGKGTDKGKGGKGGDTTGDDTGTGGDTTGGDTGTGDESGTGDDSGKGKDKGKGKGKDGTTTPDDDEDDAGEDDDAEGEDDDAEDGSGNPHHGAGPHSGTVSSFRGACPTVTFNLKGLTVSTTEATEFSSEAGEATCEMLRPNVQVLVTGEPGTASRTFVAATVTIVRTH